MRWCGDCVNWELSSTLRTFLTPSMARLVLVDVQRLRWTSSCVVGCANTSVASGAHPCSLAHTRMGSYETASAQRTIRENFSWGENFDACMCPARCMMHARLHTAHRISQNRPWKRRKSSIMIRAAHYEQAKYINHLIAEASAENRRFLYFHDLPRLDDSSSYYIYLYVRYY